jgi:hypothetical protein
LIALALLGVSSTASDSADFACKLRHGERTVTSLKKLPPDIRRALVGVAGQIADRDEPFNRTDVISRPLPFSRFIRADAFSEYWSVWYEHGGRGTSKQILIFDQEIGLHAAKHRRSQSTNLCADTDKLYDELLRP